MTDPKPEWRPTVKLTDEQFDELVDALDTPDPAPDLERAARRGCNRDGSVWLQEKVQGD